MRHDGKPLAQAFIVEGQYLGEGRRTFDKRGLLPTAPMSYAFFCPHCGEIWARCPVSLPGSSKFQPFQALSKLCRKCPEQARFNAIIHCHDLPGSLWLSWDQGFTDGFSDEVLLRELQLLLNLYPED